MAEAADGAVGGAAAAPAVAAVEVSSDEVLARASSLFSEPEGGICDDSDPYSVIQPGLLLGGAAAAVDVALHAAHGIRLVVNCAGNDFVSPSEALMTREVGVRSVLTLDLLDRETHDLSEAFALALPAIAYYRRKGEGVFIHCKQGVSRSASVLLAYLVSHEGMSLLDALSLVRSKRRVLPNVGFATQLLALERRVRGSVSMPTRALAAHPWFCFVFDSVEDGLAYVEGRIRG